MKKVFYGVSQHPFYKGFQNTEDAQYFASEDVQKASSNNADMLFLEGCAVKVLKKNRYFGHADKVCVGASFSNLFPFMQSGFRYLTKGRLRCSGFHTEEGASGKRRYVCFSVHNKKSFLGERSYFPEGWSHREFINFLNHEKIEYVVLRWQQNIENWPEGDDIDLLVSDDDISRLRDALDVRLGTKPVDLHAVSGGESGRHDKMAYFPPALAKEILSRKVLENGMWMPCKEDMLKCFAYHLIFHKGKNAKLAASAAGPKKPGRYSDELERLAGIAGGDINPDYESVYAFLESQNFVPPLDMISRISHDNAWVKENLTTTTPEPDVDLSKLKNISVIILRDIVREWGNLKELREDILSEGFDIVLEKELSKDEQSFAAHEIRGGNWSAGPWPTNGGKPYYMFILKDENPIKPNAKQLKQYPNLENARVLFKREWRDAVNGKLADKALHANFVHASDNAHESYDYIKIIAPDFLESL